MSCEVAASVTWFLCVLPWRWWWWISNNLLFRWSQPCIKGLDEEVELELDEIRCGWWLSSSALASSTTSTEEDEDEMDFSLWSWFSLLDQSQSSWAIASMSWRISNVSFWKTETRAFKTGVEILQFDEKTPIEKNSCIRKKFNKKRWCFYEGWSF